MPTCMYFRSMTSKFSFFDRHVRNNWFHSFFYLSLFSVKLMHLFLQISLGRRVVGIFFFFFLFFWKFLATSSCIGIWQGYPIEPLSPENEYHEIIQNSQLFWKKLQQYSTSLPTNFKLVQFSLFLSILWLQNVFGTVYSLQVFEV